ncbi:MAG: GtrA family protein [Bacteroidales bacterium]
MKISNEHRSEIFRFAVTGTLITIILYTVYLPLTYIMPLGVAYSCGFIISFISNFLLSNYYTFKTKPTPAKATLFCVVQFINYLLQILCFKFFIMLGVSKVWAPVPVWIFIFPVNFILMRISLKSGSTKDLIFKILNIENDNSNKKE